MAGHPAKDCLREPLVSDLPLRCQQLKKGYGDCKRGMIDMRKRFRGNKPLGSSTEGSGRGESKYIDGVGDGMLYASIGRKAEPPRQEIGWSAVDDEARARDELVPGRFKDESGSAGSYFAGYVPPSEENVVKPQPQVKSVVNDREGAGWSWWRGS